MKNSELMTVLMSLKDPVDHLHFPGYPAVSGLSQSLPAKYGARAAIRRDAPIEKKMTGNDENSLTIPLLQVS
jgi:hypothetical protein